MRNLNISTYGVEEMSKQEMKANSGGAIFTLAALALAGKWILGVCAAGIAADIVLNPSNTANKFMEGYNSVRN